MFAWHEVGWWDVVRCCTCPWVARGGLLDKALLVLAFGVDRGLGLVDLLAAREEESGGGEGGCEGSDRELLYVSLCFVTQLVLFAISNTSSPNLHLPVLALSSQGFAQHVPSRTRAVKGLEMGLRRCIELFAEALGGQRTTCDPTWRPAIVYIATILAVGFGGSGLGEG